MISWAALGLILTASQVNALNLAYQEGSKYGLGMYLQAIILVESSACIHKRGDDGNSFGCGQLQVATARKICRCSVSENKLYRNDKFNLGISAAYLSDCFSRFWPDRDRSLLCFNEGPFHAAKASANQVQRSQYVRKVKAYLRQLQQIPVDTK